MCSARILGMENKSGTKISEIVEWLNQVAPLELSESWDNTGLLVGCEAGDVTRIQTCLTLTAASVQEAIDKQAQLVISHHPLPFKPIAKVTTSSQAGKLLWQLASNGIAVYAPHTAWDSAQAGINALLADILGLADVQPIVPSELSSCSALGAGRIGALADSESLESIVEKLREAIPSTRPRAVHGNKPIGRIAIACGSGGSLLGAAIEKDCDLFLTGEATFHTCLEAEAASVSMLMIGHFASERFAMENLAGLLVKQFPSVETWASEREADPVTTM